MINMILGIEDVKTFKFALKKKDADIYFSDCVNTIPDFTQKPTAAWRFKTKQEAEKAKNEMGVWYHDLLVCEIHQA